MPSYHGNSGYLVFTTDESEHSRCPVCKSQLEYGKAIILDVEVKYPWCCSSCSVEGIEFAKLVFSGHHVKDASVPKEKRNFFVRFGHPPNGGSQTVSPDAKVLFRVEHEITPVRHLAVRCPHCEAWLRVSRASASAIPDMVSAEFARYECPECGLEFCPAEIGGTEAEECGSADQVYRECAQ